jgi:hypothetical protein
MSDRDLPRREVGRFVDVHAIRDLFDEVFLLNCAIETGDIVSPKAALPKARKAVESARKALKAEGLDVQYLDAYVAAGGWIGVSYTYAFPCGTLAQGSTVPRPVR